jgi:hypothetical protein
LTNKIIILNRIEIICFNAIFFLIVIGLQFLYYYTAPAIDPNGLYKDNVEKKAICLQTAMNFNKTLLIELTIAAILIYFFNYKYFHKTSQKPIRITLLIVLIFIIITGLALTYLTIDYINRNME